jgi:hypothetical protein
MRNMKKSLSILVLLLLSFADGFSVRGPPQRHVCLDIEKQQCPSATRRSVVEDISASLGLILSTVLLTHVNVASASGGATAGGVYLLSVSLKLCNVKQQMAIVSTILT